MNNTLFILGAGSNQVFGYPTGADLRTFLVTRYEQILPTQLLAKEESYDKEIKRETAQNVKKFAEVFFKSSVSSIDAFLERNQDFEFTGKLGIIYQLLESERISRYKEHLTKDSWKDWYFWLYNNKLIPPVSTSDSFDFIKSIPIRFISFNYDRSLENFLFESIENTYHNSELAKMVRNEALKIPILDVKHVYGCFAKLPWQEEDLASFNYKKKPPFIVSHYIKNINLIGQRAKTENEEINKLFDWAKDIFFLGFGFAVENTEILALNRNVTKNHRVFGTSMGLSENDIHRLKSMIVPSGISEHNINFQNIEIVNLLKYYLS